MGRGICLVFEKEHISIPDLSTQVTSFDRQVMHVLLDCLVPKLLAELEGVTNSKIPGVGLSPYVAKGNLKMRWSLSKPTDDRWLDKLLAILTYPQNSSALWTEKSFVTVAKPEVGVQSRQINIESTDRMSSIDQYHGPILMA